MLEAAHQLKAEGVDVVVGYVETHKRAETEALIKGLDVIPTLMVPYRGAHLPEMDVDVILVTVADLMLVDVLGYPPHPASTLVMDEKEYSVARWAFDHGRSVGRFTDTLPSAAAQYLPLRTPDSAVGVIGIKTRRADALSFDQQVL
jgi:K+-sensing histidine kinase KdpD